MASCSDEPVDSRNSSFLKAKPCVALRLIKYCDGYELCVHHQVHTSVPLEGDIIYKLLSFVTSSKINPIKGLLFRLNRQHEGVFWRDQIPVFEWKERDVVYCQFFARPYFTVFASKETTLANQGQRFVRTSARQFVEDWPSAIHCRC